MISNSEIRARARDTLGKSIFNEKWLYALLVGLIVSAISFVAAYIPFASIIITGPISVGVAGVFLAATRTGEKIKIGNMFNGFHKFAENLLLYLYVSLGAAFHHTRNHKRILLLYGALHKERPPRI